MSISSDSTATIALPPPAKIINFDGQNIDTSVPVGPIGLQGVARKVSGNINEYINRAADPRLNSILKKTNSPLRMGIIQQLDDIVDPSVQKFPYACRFMFNPSVINVGYQVATGVLPPQQLTVDQLAAAPIYPGSTSIGFSLLFDRTYDVAYGPNIHQPTDLRRIGVYHDIQALERVVGVQSPTKYTFGADDTAHTGSDPGMMQGNMLFIPVYVLFGGGSVGVGLAWVGYFTSIDVQYTLFSQNMVPTRALVNLTLTQLIGRGVTDYQNHGGTLINRAHPGLGTTGSGKNPATPKALPKRSVANS